MTAAQSLRLYEILQRHFQNEADAKAVVGEIEQTIENRFQTERSILATKEDIARLETKIAESKSDIIRWVFAFFVGVALMVIGLYIKK